MQQFLYFIPANSRNILKLLLIISLIWLHTKTAVGFFTFNLIIIISIQPEGRFWQEPEPSQATGMVLAHCILGSFLGVGCHCFPPPLDVPTFASRCLHVQAT